MSGSKSSRSPSALQAELADQFAADLGSCAREALLLARSAIRAGAQRLKDGKLTAQDAISFLNVAERAANMETRLKAEAARVEMLARIRRSARKM